MLELPETPLIPPTMLGLPETPLIPLTMLGLPDYVHVIVLPQENTHAHTAYL